MTQPIEAAALAANGASPQPAHAAAQPRHAPPAAALRDLHDIAIRLNANPLIAAIDAHNGMGQHLTAQDVDTVMRVIASIEAARIEVSR